MLKNRASSKGSQIINTLTEFVPIRALAGLADMAIVGSHLLRLYHEGGVGRIEGFLQEV